MREWAISPGCWGQFSHGVASPALLIQSPARGRVSYPGPVRDRTVSAQPQISTSMVLVTPVVTQAMNISADPGCCWTMDPDMADGSSPFPATCCYTGHSDCHDPLRQRGPWTPTWIQVTAQTPGIGIAFDNIRSHGHQHRSILPIHVTVFLYSTATCIDSYSHQSWKMKT